MTSAAVPDKHYFVALKGALSAHQVLLLPFRDKDGSISLHPAHSPKLDRLPKLVQEERYTSIVIMSHGWNTTPYDGRLMYRYWFSHLQEANAAVADGDKVVKGDLILVLEAMKMEQPLTAHKDGTITGINATVGSTVSSGHLLMNIAD